MADRSVDDEKISLLVSQLKNEGWEQISDDTVESRKSFVHSQNQWLFSIETLKHKKENLCWISSRKNLAIRYNLFQIPQIVVSQIPEPLSLPDIHSDFKVLQLLLRCGTNADFKEISIINTDLSIFQIFSKYSHQLEQLSWRLCSETHADTFHASSWSYKETNCVYHLMLGINLLDANGDHLVTIFVDDTAQNYYPYFSIQTIPQQSKTKSIPAELVQKLAEVFQENTASIEFVPENLIPEYMSMPLPPSSEVIGSVFTGDGAIKVFTNFPLTAWQSRSYITENLQALGWEACPIPLMSGKGFIDSGFDSFFPRYFFWPNIEKGEKQISIRTFPLSRQWTDVEIEYGSKTFESVSNDEFNSWKEMFLEYPVLPSLNPHDNSFVEILGESLDHGLYCSKAHVQSALDIEILIAHYTEQLANSVSWNKISDARSKHLFTSTWNAKDSKNRIWTGILSLAGIEKNSENYLMQFIAFQGNKQQSKKQSYFRRLTKKLTAALS